MGSIKKPVILIFLLIIFYSCSLLEKGFTNSNNQYVPKKPKFKLKDKPGNTIPPKLDLQNIYILKESFFDNKPVTYYGNDESYEKYNSYYKFYENGRCLSFALKKDNFGNPNLLTKEHLNPNNAYYGKDYYYSFDGTNLEIESFVYGTGYGNYITRYFLLSENGDTLTLQDSRSKEVYIVYEIPKSWNGFIVDW